MPIDFAAAELIRDIAAMQTFEELADWDEETPLKPGALDDLILRGRDLVDTLGLHPE